MATVTHLLSKAAITAASDNPRLLLTNQDGDFLALGNPNASNYDGLFFRIDGVYHKTVANIAPAQPTRSLELDGVSATRFAHGCRQRFWLLDDGLLADCEGEFLLTLDCKRLYDESDKGRIYAVSVHNADASGAQDERLAADALGRVSVADVLYTKYPDDRLAEASYALHLCIATNMRMTREGSWRETSYPYDARRGTKSTPWVFDAVRLDGTGFVAVAHGGTPAQARQRAVAMLVEKETRTRSLSLAYAKALPTLPVKAQLAWRALRALRTRTCIMAGLPWFFQEWSRDELISCGGLIVTKEYDTVIGIIERWYACVRADGTLPALYPDGGLTSSDAPGWLGKRTRDLLVRMSADGILRQVPEETLVRWRERTGVMIDTTASRMRDGLVWNGTNTTWMDTAHNDDGRAGARIEIQALFLALYDAHTHLCALTRTVVAPGRADAARRVIEAIRQRLVIGDRLLDGLHEDGSQDPAVRPNIFLAWYIAPNLFTRDEWRGFFAAALPELWLPWGGLASISVHDGNYCPQYTGEDVASYHRGDSWYFVNNIAAIALHAISPEEFGPQTEAILRASMDDLVSQGFAGHASEVSSAQRQEACGCHAQAWSASTLLEALLAADKR